MDASSTFLTGLGEEIARSSTQRLSETLRRVTDIFIASSHDYSDEQIALFDDVMVALTRAVEKETRILLARRLAPLGNAPPSIIRLLACDDMIEVASPVLTESDRLDDTALVQTAMTKSQLHLLAISRRRRLSDTVTDALVERGGGEVLLSTVANPGAHFSHQGYATLVTRSDGNDTLAACVGSRPDIPPHLFLKLLAAASEAVRVKLAAENPRARREINDIVAEVSGRMRDDVIGRSDYSLALESVEILEAAGELNATQLEAFASIHRVPETTAALALMCKLPASEIERALRDERPDLLLIICKATDLPWSTVKALLKVRAGERRGRADNLEACLATFERLKQTTARNIVQFYCTRSMTQRQN